MKFLPVLSELFSSDSIIFMIIGFHHFTTFFKKINRTELSDV